MRTWNRTQGGHWYTVMITVEFEEQSVEPPSLRELVPSSLPGLVKASPEFVAHHRMNPAVDYYFNEHTYWKLPFFTKENYSGVSTEVRVEDAKVECLYGNGVPQNEEYGLAPEVFTCFIASLIQERGWIVKHWEVFEGPQDDQPTDSSVHFVQGGHQELVKYLELD